MQIEFMIRDADRETDGSASGDHRRSGNGAR
jgi:hypothetical protein